MLGETLNSAVLKGRVGIDRIVSSIPKVAHQDIFSNPDGTTIEIHTREPIGSAVVVMLAAAVSGGLVVDPGSLYRELVTVDIHGQGQMMLDENAIIVHRDGGKILSRDRARQLVSVS